MKPTQWARRPVLVRAVLAPLVSFTLFAPPSAMGQANEPPALRVRERVEVRGIRALREPMVVQHASGTLFTAGYSRAPEEFDDPPDLYRSDDGGRNWSQVDVGTREEGASGNSDVDLAIGPDGTIYFISMRFDRSVGEGTDIAVGVSRDVGRTWRWQYLARRRFVDRPWVAVSSTGRVHAIWNDGDGVSHVTSDDEGRTWTERPRVAPLGGSSHLAVGPDGRIAVRITPLSASGNRFDGGIDSLAISADDGLTWRVVAPPGHRGWSPEPLPPEAVPRWVEPIAWGTSGALYSLWSEGTELWLGRSDDLGTSWDVSPLLQGTAPLYYPLLIAGPDGRMAASWYSGFGAELRAHVGLVAPGGRGVLDGRSAPLDVDAWRLQGARRIQDSAGEYFPVLFLAGGDLGAVLPIQESERGDGFSWLRISGRKGR